MTEHRPAGMVIDCPYIVYTVRSRKYAQLQTAILKKKKTSLLKVKRLQPCDKLQNTQTALVYTKNSLVNTMEGTVLVLF